MGIGDGANDVGMIQEADIGIGISGVEGMQVNFHYKLNYEHGGVGIWSIIFHKLNYDLIIIYIYIIIFSLFFCKFFSKI